MRRFSQSSRTGEVGQRPSEAPLNDIMQAAAKRVRTQERPRCFLCGAEGKPFLQGLVDPFYGVEGTWNFKRCATPGCGLIWLDPMPVSEDLHLAYQQYFTHGESENKPSSAKRLRAVLYGMYQTASAVPATVLGLRHSQRRLENMYLDDLRPGRLLDVGCGDGIFLARMRKCGWDVEGVDVDAKAIEHGKAKYGLRLHCGDLASVRLPDSSFDAVTLSHVVEHIPDPTELLKEVRRILKPGGRLVLTTPNNGSQGLRRFQGYWFGLDAPRHLHVFSLDALSRLARTAGFEDIQATSTAARADIFIGASFSIESAKDHRSEHQPPPHPLRTLKAVMWQYREHFALRAQPDCGEEAVLIAAKARS